VSLSYLVLIEISVLGILLISLSVAFSLLLVLLVSKPKDVLLIIVFNSLISDNNSFFDFSIYLSKKK